MWDRNVDKLGAPYLALVSAMGGVRQLLAHSLVVNSVCGGLNENGPLRLTYLNVWSPVGGTVWEGSGRVVFLEVCHWKL